MAIFKNGPGDYSDVPAPSALELVSSLGRLVPKPPPENTLPEVQTPDAIRAKTGFEPKSAGKVNGTQVTVKSTDGLFTFTVTIAKT